MWPLQARPEHQRAVTAIEGGYRVYKVVVLLRDPDFAGVHSASLLLLRRHAMSGQGSHQCKCTRFKGKVVVITGSTAGIGLATAERLGLEGAKGALLLSVQLSLHFSTHAPAVQLAREIKSVDIVFVSYLPRHICNCPMILLQHPEPVCSGCEQQEERVRQRNSRKSEGKGN